MDYTAIEWDRAALIVIDVQNDFLDGALPVLGTAEIIPAVVELVNSFRAAGRPNVHAIRLYVPGGSDVDLVRREAIEQGARVVAPGSIGAQIPASLTGNIPLALDHEKLLKGQPQEIGANEAVIYKPRWSAFFRTGLSQWLAERDVTSVVVAGCNLPNCPRATLFDASERDLRAAVVLDATSQTTPGAPGGFVVDRRPAGHSGRGGSAVDLRGDAVAKKPLTR